MSRPWQVVTIALPVRCGWERGPRTPIGGIRCGPSNTYEKTDMPHGNRGDNSGSESYGRRDHLGTFTWVDGLPPAPVGVVCDERWQPIPFAEIPDSARPLGGYTRAELKHYARGDS